MNWLGLDIGGANLKLADGLGYADTHPFALWQDYTGLTQRLRLLIAQAPQADHIVVTMTGELADCFANRNEGVKYILDAVQQAADGRHTRVYLSSGKLVTPQVASRRTAEVAAANWHALGTYCARLAPAGLALVVDVGSTTTDNIPLLDGQLAAEGIDDTGRLLAGELVYLGVQRSPVCSLVGELPYRDSACPIARELFATTQDVYVILGDLAENSTFTQTADGRPATKPCARTRLGRMVCAQEDSFNHRDAVEIARAVDEAVLSQVTSGIEQVVSRFGQELRTVVVVGVGEFLVRRAIKHLEMEPQILSFGQQYGPGPSRSAPAHAIAALARETGNP
jgi:probable H4MPT-linked C1 transfer pathway protein